MGSSIVYFFFERVRDSVCMGAIIYLSYLCFLHVTQHNAMFFFINFVILSVRDHRKNDTTGIDGLLRRICQPFPSVFMVGSMAALRAGWLSVPKICIPLCIWQTSRC
jgi:hypothetical protein